jgi:uroporphyrinogen III methyltransferase/synthase
MAGKVYLVGAGPGDPSLITRRGWDLVEQADVLVVDDLVHPYFSHLNPRAKIIYVGKRGPASPRGRIQIYPQGKINRILIQLARRGQRVVRLKGGDPLVFGRGGEEMESLRAARIPYEIVPGVSSVVAAPAYAGIPLSDRRWASTVTLLTGQESQTEESVSRVEWSQIPRNGTLVVLMGVQKWAQIRKNLLSHGWRADTPVAVVESATGTGQREFQTDLNSSLTLFKRERIVSPAVIVVGTVAKLHRRLAWLRKEKPLLGQVVVVTRAEAQSKIFNCKLEDLGAIVVPCPAIAIQPLALDATEKNKISQWKSGRLHYDWILFLSENAVSSFSEAVGVLPRRLTSRIAVVGPRTAAAAKKRGWPVHKIARQFNAANLIKNLGSISGRRILLPRVHMAPDRLDLAIRKKGAHLDVVSTYQNRPASPPPATLKKFILNYANAVTFTSASTADAFRGFWSSTEFKKLFKKAKAVSIGPQTTRALNKAGLRFVWESRPSTSDALVQTLIQRMKR